jgi:hypothetical protein
MTNPYRKAPIELSLQTAWGELKTHLSSFQLDRPMKFEKDQIVPLRAFRRHFRLPKALDKETIISIGKTPLLSFQHCMQRSGDVPDITMNTIVRIEEANVDGADTDENNTIVATLLRGEISIDLSDLKLNQWWPNQGKKPSRVHLEADNLWLEFSDPILEYTEPIIASEEPPSVRLRPRQAPIKQGDPCEWGIIDCTPYQEYLKAELSKRLPQGLGLSLESHGAPEGSLIVSKDGIERRIKHPLTFVGGDNSSWTPAWVVIQAEGKLDFADELPPNDSLATSLVQGDGSHLTVTVAKDDPRNFALIGSSVSSQLQGDGLWSYQTNENLNGWIRWQTCRAETIRLLTNDHPFTLNFIPTEKNQWGWKLDLFRDPEGKDSGNQISFRIDQEGHITVRARQFNVMLVSPDLKLYSSEKSLVDSHCPPPQLDPEDILSAGKLCFVLAENRSDHGPGVTLPWNHEEPDSESTPNDRQIFLSENMPIRGNVVWAGPPEPNQAWIFSESIVGRNLVFGPETAWDPHAGKRLVPLEEIKLTSSEDTGMTVVGEPKMNSPFQGTMALLPWVEGSRDDQGEIQYKVYHRNLICEIDEARAGREDRGVLPGQLDPLSDHDRTRAVRDTFSLLAEGISAEINTISRANFWPGLLLEDLNLSLTPKLSPEQATTLPSIEINGRSMQLRKQASNPPNLLPNHPADWLDYRVHVTALLGDGGKPNPVAKVRTDGENRLHTSLVIKDGSWLDQTGALWQGSIHEGSGLMKGLLIQHFWQAKVDGDSTSWRACSLLSGTIQLADDASNDHSIELYLDSFLVDRTEPDTFNAATQPIGAVMQGAWKLMAKGEPAQPPKLFGFALEGLAVVSLSEQEVIVVATLLSPSCTQARNENSIKLKFNGSNKIAFDDSSLAYNFLPMESLPFPHGGLSGQLILLSGNLSLEENCLKLEPSNSKASTLGSSWDCHPPKLRGQDGRWTNWEIPVTSDSFWIEDLSVDARFSCHQVHLEAADAEPEDLSHAGFLIYDHNQCSFRSLYQPDIPQKAAFDASATSDFWVDVLICRRQLWLSAELMPTAPLPIFLSCSNGQPTLCRGDQSQQLPNNSEIANPEGGLLIPVSMGTDKKQRSIAVVLWNDERLVVYFPATKSEDPFKPISLLSILPQQVFRIPNYDNQFLLIDRTNQIYRVTCNVQSQTLTPEKLQDLSFSSISKLVGVDASSFIIYDAENVAWYCENNNLTASTPKIPDSKDSLIAADLNQANSVRLFMARWMQEDGMTIISCWSPHSTGTTPIAKINAKVNNVLSTPLGPWWINQEGQQLSFYNMNDWVEWDQDWLRADLKVDINLFQPEQTEQAPFALEGRISRGNTLTVTHHDTRAKTFSPAWPRQVQGPYIGFSVPSHPHQERVSTIWSKGLLVLWPEVAQGGDGENGEANTTCLAGVWLRESWERHDNKLTGTLHTLRVDWVSEQKWKHELIVTGQLKSSTTNWSLQLHEQRWDPKRWALGLMILKQGSATIQLPVRCRPTDNGDGVTSEVEIDFGNNQKNPLYLVRQVTMLGSMASIDLVLPDGTSDQTQSQQICYDIKPVTLGESDLHWCHLNKVPNSEDFQLMSVGAEEKLTVLVERSTADLPKHPIKVMQLAHRRVFGARLRFGDGVETYSATTQNSWNTIGDAEREDVDDFNLDSLIHIGKALLKAKEKTEANNLFLKKLKERKKIWNAESRKFVTLSDINIIHPGDHFTAWEPVGDNHLPHQPEPIKFKQEQRYIGALTAQYENSIWLLQEPLWVEQEGFQECLTENVLVIGRPSSLVSLKDVEADPAVECLRSVSDLVSSEAKRGISGDKLSAFLLATGSAGVVVRRLFQGAGPPEYHFPRSPFSAGVGEVSIPDPNLGSEDPIQRQLQAPAPPDPQAPVPNGLLNPSSIHLRHQSWPNQVHSARYTPSLEPSVPRLPAFNLDFRQVCFELQDDIAGREQALTGQRTLLLQEAVCYPNRIQNDPSHEKTDEGLSNSKGTFHPQCLDLVYGVDKPGGMLSHSVELRFTPQNLAQPSTRGVTTMFSMRDPRQVIIPPGAALRIKTVKPDKSNVELEFEEVLGTLMAPKVNLSDAITRSENKYILNREAVLVMTIVGDELIALPHDAPYLPLDKEPVQQKSADVVESQHQFRRIYMVSRGRLSDAIVCESHDFHLDEIELEYETPLTDPNNDTPPIDPNSYLYLSVVKFFQTPDGKFQITWKSTDNLPLTSRQGILNYYGTGQDDLSKQYDDKTNSKPLLPRLIPALATPKLGVVTSSINENTTIRQDRMELFATAKGGTPNFRATQNMIEGANLYNVSWRRSVMEGPNALHVIKYFADGQTLCDITPFPC